MQYAVKQMVFKTTKFRAFVLAFQTPFLIQNWTRFETILKNVCLWMALKSDLCTEWGFFLACNHDGNCIVSFSLIFKMFCTIKKMTFTISYNLTSEGAQLPSSVFQKNIVQWVLSIICLHITVCLYTRGWEMTAPRVVCVSVLSVC